MRIPVPKHTLVALTLVGALLTTVVAVGLVSPALLPDVGGQDDTSNAVPLADDAPTPNENFTPAVQTSSGGSYEEHEHEEYEEEEEHEEYDDDHEEDD